jgi:TolB-like protein/Tfp pilus assembly protein PilF
VTESGAERQGNGPWAKLRQRKVVQWGLAYLAGAWGSLQALEFLSETYSWSPQVRMLAVPALLLGLPIVVVLAWYHGDRGHQRVTRSEFVILTLLVSLGTGVIWRYHQALESAKPAAGASPQGRAAAAVANPADDPRPSVAVLPFENRSANADDAYFADGIQDDIVTQLSKLPGLRVIASTSTEKLRGTTLSAREIGEQLGVAKLLQGRVQRAGDRVRINVLLVDTSTESQEWAERYDRSVTGSNVLAIQSEVAATVAARLKTGMPSSESDGPGTAKARNLQAWEAYQRGRDSHRWADAEQNFRRAIEADPGFAPAYVGLSNALVRQIFTSGARRDVNLPEAEAAIETALRLDPKLPDALLASADFVMDREGPAAAEATIRKAIESNPNYANAYERLSDMLFGEGRIDEAARYAQKGVALDPLSIGLRGSLAAALEATGRYDEAEAQYRRALEIDPSSSSALMNLAEFEAYVRGRFALAVTLQEKAVQLAPDDAYLVAELAGLYMDLGDDTRAAELLDDATSRWPDRTNVNFWAAVLATYRGDPLSAMRYATKVLETSPKHLGGIYILTAADIARGDPEAARARFAFAYPEFLAPVPPEIGPHDLDTAEIAASILLANHDPGRARVLLDRAELALRSAPRPGAREAGIDEAQIRAMRGDKAGAVRAVRDAVKAGWRGPNWRGFLLFNRDLVALQGDPGFQDAVAEIRRDMAKQRAELAATTSGTTVPGQ